MANADTISQFGVRTVGLFTDPAIKKLRTEVEAIGQLEVLLAIGEISPEDYADVFDGIGPYSDNVVQAYHNAVAVVGESKARKVAVKHVRMIADAHARARDLGYRWEIQDGAESTFNRILSRRDKRDIPQLYPDFFDRILIATGHSRTEKNLEHLIDRVAFMIHFARAMAYFDQAGDEGARREFLQRFPDPPKDGDKRRLCDEMIDWLWEWDPRCRDDLREGVKKTEAALVGPESALRGVDEVPPWNDGD